MSYPFILIIDEYKETELIVRQTFESFAIKVRQVTDRENTLLIEDDIQIILISDTLTSEDPLQLASDLALYYPKAALYFLTEGQTSGHKGYDIGALEVFTRPVQKSDLRSSFEVILNTFNVLHQQVPPLVSSIFNPISSDDETDSDAEALAQLQELLKIQLLTDVKLRSIIRRIVLEEMNSLKAKNIPK
jgi:hypothetical protein